MGSTQAIGLPRALNWVVDERFGVVEWISQLPSPAGDPACFHYAAKAADTQAFARNQNFSNTGGASRRRDLAIAKAVGEAVERYCSAVFDVVDLPLCTRADAPFACIEPDAWIL